MDAVDSILDADAAAPPKRDAVDDILAADEASTPKSVASPVAVSRPPVDAGFDTGLVHKNSPAALVQPRPDVPGMSADTAVRPGSRTSEPEDPGQFPQATPFMQSVHDRLAPFAPSAGNRPSDVLSAAGSKGVEFARGLSSLPMEMIVKPAANLLLGQTMMGQSLYRALSDPTAPGAKDQLMDELSGETGAMVRSVIPAAKMALEMTPPVMVGRGLEALRTAPNMAAAVSPAVDIALGLAGAHHMATGLGKELGQRADFSGRLQLPPAAEVPLLPPAPEVDPTAHEFRTPPPEPVPQLPPGNPEGQTIPGETIRVPPAETPAPAPERPLLPPGTESAPGESVHVPPEGFSQQPAPAPDAVDKILAADEAATPKPAAAPTPPIKGLALGEVRTTRPAGPAEPKAYPINSADLDRPPTYAAVGLTTKLPDLRPWPIDRAKVFGREAPPVPDVPRLGWNREVAPPYPKLPGQGGTAEPPGASYPPLNGEGPPTIPSRSGPAIAPGKMRRASPPDVARLGGVSEGAPEYPRLPGQGGSDMPPGPDYPPLEPGGEPVTPSRSGPGIAPGKLRRISTAPTEDVYEQPPQREPAPYSGRPEGPGRSAGPNPTVRGGTPEFDRAVRQFSDRADLERAEMGASQLPKSGVAAMAAASASAQNKGAPDSMIPTLPPVSDFSQAIEHPGRHVTLADKALTGSNKPGSYFGPTEAQAAQLGIALKEGTGGNGLGRLMAETKARSEWTAREIADRVLGEEARGLKAGGVEDQAMARVIQDIATPADRQMMVDRPRLQKIVDRWRQLAQEALADPKIKINGILQNYLTKTGDPLTPKTLLSLIDEMERGAGWQGLDTDPATQFLQVHRTPGGVATSVLRAAKQYGRAIGFEREMRPTLERISEYKNLKDVEGKPLLDGVDQRVLDDFVRDAYVGKEQVADVLARRWAPVRYGTALVNKALNAAGMPTIDNPLKSAMGVGQMLTTVTGVRPLAAALSHFLGDAFPKIAREGVGGGVSEYMQGAGHLVELWKNDPAMAAEIEQLGVVDKPNRVAAWESSAKGMSIQARAAINLVKHVDVASKLGTYFTELDRLTKAGVPVAEAKSMASAKTAALNYYSGAIFSPPLASSRPASAFYQFNKGPLNAADQVARWVQQGQGKELVRTALGLAGLAALGSFVGMDLIHRIHALPDLTNPAMLHPHLTDQFTDPLGVHPSNRRRR